MPKLKKTRKENQQCKGGLDGRILRKKSLFLPEDVADMMKQLNPGQFAGLLLNKHN